MGAWYQAVSRSFPAREDLDEKKEEEEEARPPAAMTDNESRKLRESRVHDVPPSRGSKNRRR